jgi:uncharacterized protein YceK
MREITIGLALLATVAALGGCATATNLGPRGEYEVYGGARLDATLMSEGFAPDPDSVKKNKLERPVLFCEGCYGLVDLPISLVADTITLPLTIPASMNKYEPDAKPAEAAGKN